MKVLFFVLETAGLPQWGAKKRMPVKLGCMPANDAADQWMLMGGEWGSEGGGEIMRLGHGKSREKRGAHPSPHPPVGSSWSALLWSNLQIVVTFRSYILL